MKYSLGDINNFPREIFKVINQNNDSIQFYQWTI